jgi:hypothetical protein
MNEMSNQDNTPKDWQKVGNVVPTQLGEARNQLHNALQLVAAAGKSLIPERADDSHTSFQWQNDLRAFVGEPIEATEPFRVGLRFADLTLILVGDDERKINKFPLGGRTRYEAFDWLREQAAALGADASRLSMQMHYEIPPHPIQEGQPFTYENPAAFEELSRFFANADGLLCTFAANQKGASPVRCWPHHFDSDMVITVGSSTIGLGFSPGDDSYSEPYFYLSIRPFPKTEGINLPELQGGGEWHTQGWVGPALPASSIVADTAYAQASQVAAFVSSGSAAAKVLVEGSRQ